MKRNVWAGVACSILIGLGLLTSAYLFQRTLLLSSARSDAGADVCSILFQATCDEALLSSYGNVLGLSLAAWGVVYFGAIGFLFAFGQLFKEGFQRESLVALLCLDVAAVGIGVALSTQFFTGSVPFCPLCIEIHVINVALFPLLFVVNGQSPRQVAATLGAGARWLLGGKSDDSSQAAWKAVGFLAAGLFAVLLFQWALLRTERVARTAAEGPAFEELMAEFQTMPLQDLPIDEADPRMGPETARVEVVVFSSFQCPGCRGLAPVLTSLQSRFRDDVTLVFKHFPLGTDCNPTLGRNMHPRACALAAAAVAAHMQGQFWAFHDALFATSLNPSEEQLAGISADIELDLARFNADRSSDEAALKVRRDVELGVQLGVTETPAVFVNGKRVPSDGLRMLARLIEEVLDGM